MQTAPERTTGRLLSIREVGERLGVSRPVVDRLIRDGEIVGFKVRATWKLHERSVEDFIKRNSNRSRG